MFGCIIWNSSRINITLFAYLHKYLGGERFYLPSSYKYKVTQNIPLQLQNNSEFKKTQKTYNFKLSALYGIIWKFFDWVLWKTYFYFKIEIKFYYKFCGQRKEQRKELHCE